MPRMKILVEMTIVSRSTTKTVILNRARKILEGSHVTPMGTYIESIDDVTEGLPSRKRGRILT